MVLMDGQEKDCAKCYKHLSPTKSWPKCSICKKYNHFKCLKFLHHATYRGWTLSQKNLWVCDSCEISENLNSSSKKRTFSSPSKEELPDRLFPYDRLFLTVCFRLLFPTVVCFQPFVSDRFHSRLTVDCLFPQQTVCFHSRPAQVCIY